MTKFRDWWNHVMGGNEPKLVEPPPPRPQHVWTKWEVIEGKPAAMLIPPREAVQRRHCTVCGFTEETHLPDPQPQNIWDPTGTPECPPLVVTEA